MPLSGPAIFFPTFQPPHSPEFNPIERLWLQLKKAFAWTNVPTLDSLKQKLSTVLDSFSKESLASLTSYDFILEALFGAAL